MRLFFVLLLSLICLSCSGQSVVGEYASVTETEYSIELSLQSGGKAVLVLGVVAVDEDEHDWRKSITGVWTLDGSTLRVDLATDGVVEYEVRPCLSFGEFGYEGCGFGIKAMSISTKDVFQLKRYGLWRKESLPPNVWQE